MPSVPVPSAVVVLHTNMDSVAAFGVDLEFLRYEAAAGEVEALVVGTPDPGCIPGRQRAEPCRDRQHRGRPQESHEQFSAAHFHLDTVSDPKVPFLYAVAPLTEPARPPSHRRRGLLRHLVNHHARHGKATD